MGICDFQVKPDNIFIAKKCKSCARIVRVFCNSIHSCCCSFSCSSGGVVGPDFEPERILHHVDKLVVVDLAVAIRVHAFQ